MRVLYVLKLAVFTLFLIFTDTTLCNKQKTETDSIPHQEVWLTIVVHGIVNIKPHLSVSNLIRFMRDQITDSIYAKAVEIMRVDPFFFQYSAMQELGLVKIDPTCKYDGYASGAFALSYNNFAQLNNAQPENNIFYTYGWSGLLSTQIRYGEAELFFMAIEKEIAYYRSQGINPKIRIIGYSHGGYIALNLGAVYNNKKHCSVDWSVNELILLGVPIIADTDFLIGSLLFKKVYHFYSPGDRVQVVDCLATNRFFSHRTFCSRVGFLLPQKLTQIQFRIKRLARTNRAKKHIAHCNNIYSPKILRNADPGHTELWSFGWSMGYRSYLPLYPFPAGAFMGYLINSIKNYALNARHLVMELRPFQEKILVSSYDSTLRTEIPYPSKETVEQFTQELASYVPTNCSRAAYKQKSDKALVLADQQKKEEWSRKKYCLPRFKKRFLRDLK
jgi:hypothetical protein